MKKSLLILLATSMILVQLEIGHAGLECEPADDREQCYRYGYDEGVWEGSMYGFVFGLITTAAVIYGVVEFLKYRESHGGQEGTELSDRDETKIEDEFEFVFVPFSQPDRGEIELGAKFSFKF